MGIRTLVSWSPQATAESYAVEMSTDGVNFTAAGSVASPGMGMLVTGLSVATGCRFGVSAVNGTGSSAGTVSALVTTQATDGTGVYYVTSPDAGADGAR